MTKELNFTADAFDTTNTFPFEYVGARGKTRTGTAYLFTETSPHTDGRIYIMQRPACMKDQYSEADRAEAARLQDPANVVRDGDIVSVQGREYTVRILGNYSDAGFLVPFSAEAIEHRDRVIEAGAIARIKDEIQRTEDTIRRLREELQELKNRNA